MTRPSGSEESAIPDFNRTHLHVLQILWEAGEALKPGEIEARFRWPIENATLRSVLRTMMERGELEREKRGKAYIYRPRQEPRRTLSKLMAGLAEVFAGGSRTGLLAQLLDDSALSPAELRELQRLAGKEEER